MNNIVATRTLMLGNIATDGEIEGTVFIENLTLAECIEVMNLMFKHNVEIAILGERPQEG